MDITDIDHLQNNLIRIGEWAIENEIKINAGKSKNSKIHKMEVERFIRIN
jgi:hypothetical protein